MFNCNIILNGSLWKYSLQANKIYRYFEMISENHQVTAFEAKFRATFISTCS